MDTVSLFMRIKIEGCEACGYKIKVVDIGLDSHVDDGVDASISIRSLTSRPDILEANVLIKGLGKFVLDSLLCQKVLQMLLLLWWHIRELPVSRMEE